MKKVFQLLAVIAVGFFVHAYSAQAAGVTWVSMNGIRYSVGSSGPGWSFPEAGKLILTNADLDAIGNNDASLTDDLEIVLNGTSTVEYISLSSKGKLTISGTGTLNMTEPMLYGGTYYDYLHASAILEIKGSATVNLTNTGFTQASYTALSVGSLHVLENANLSVAMNNMEADINNIRVRKEVYFATSGSVRSTITFAPTASNNNKTNSRALMISNNYISTQQFGGTGFYEFQVDGGQQAVAFGSNQPVSFNDGMGVNIPIDGSISVIGNVATVVDALGNANQAHVKFDQPSTTLTVNCGANGTCVKNPDQAIYANGASVAIAITADTGYLIDTVTVDGSVVSAAGDETSYTVNKVMTANTVVDVTFKLNPISRILTVNCGAGGTCTGYTPIYAYGQTAFITITPSSGYEIDSVVGATLNNGKYEVFMDSNKTVDVAFRLVKYSLAVNCGSGGSCAKTPDKATYNSGEEVDVAVESDVDYVIDKWIQNGAEMPLYSGKTSANISFAMIQNHALNVTFKPTPRYTITIDPLTNGAITPSKSTDILEQTLISLTITPDTGYQLKSGTLKVMQGTTPVTVTNNTFTMPAGNVAISTEFEKIPEPIISAPIHRFYSEQFRAHFYTISEQEKQHIQQTYDPYTWNYEGIAYNASQKQATGMSPIHRFYSLTNKKHFYTISEEEKNKLIAGLYPEAQFQYEGIAWYANTNHSSTTRPLHRFYSTNSAVHFYTISEEEKNYIIATYPPQVWSYEGVAWYALR